MPVQVSALPPLHWTADGGHAEYDEAAGLLVMRAAAGVDWSNDSLGGMQQHRASALGFIAPDTFTLSARVTVDTPRTTFDAGVLSLWADEDHWAKLCFEYSPQGEAMVVSVVTNEYSDDCNSTIVAEQSVYLRVTRVGPAWAFHSSADGANWQFVRLFRLYVDAPVTVGFMSQAPMGETCVSRFDNVRFAGTAPTDLRDGS